MRCPNCHTAMHGWETQTAILVECVGCEGIWFKALDKERGRDSFAAPDRRWLEFDFWTNDTDFEARSEPLACPHCSASALTRLIDRTTNTSFCFCSRCCGIWINPLQLEGILRAIESFANRSANAGGVRDSLQQLGEMLSNAPHRSICRWRDLDAVLGMLAHRVYREHPRRVSIAPAAGKCARV